MSTLFEISDDEILTAIKSNHVSMTYVIRNRLSPVVQTLKPRTSFAD